MPDSVIAPLEPEPPVARPDPLQEPIPPRLPTGIGTGLHTVLVCPDSFKGTLTALEATDAIARGVLSAWPDAEILECPLADGGEGTLDAMLSKGGERRTALVEGPDGSRLPASWGILPNGVAVIEAAQACGLMLVPPEKRDPRTATSYGAGQLIRDAIAADCRNLIVGIGGTATNDGGMGAMRALGARFLDANGNELERGGASLALLDHIDLGGFVDWSGLNVIIASDVTNPLCGPKGATRVFGPQKGATPEVVEELEAAMANYARVLNGEFGYDVAGRQGAGAAGGLGAALIAMLRGLFHGGGDQVMDATGFDEMAERADLIITGEGKLDAQSLDGKLVSRVLARNRGVPTLLLCGALDLGEVDCLRLAASDVIGMHYGDESGLNSMEHAAEALERLATMALQKLGHGQ